MLRRTPRPEMRNKLAVNAPACLFIVVCAAAFLELTGSPLAKLSFNTEHPIASVNPTFQC